MIIRSILACVTVMCESPTDIPHAPQERHCLEPEKILDTYPTPPILTTASSPMRRSSPTGPSLLPRTGATPFVLTSLGATIISQSDYSKAAGNRAEVKTVGEGSDVSQGSNEGTKGGRTEEEASWTRERCPWYVEIAHEP